MYSIQQRQPPRASLGRGASVHNDDDEDDNDDSYLQAPRFIDHPDMPVIAPLRLHKKPSYHPSYHAHRDQHVNDYGPRVRQSRLPIFKQVRGLLHRPTPPDAMAKNVKYDEFSGDISEFGKAPDVTPSTYKNPYQGAFQARRNSRPTRQSRRPPSGRDASPVSVLNERDLHQMNSPDLGWDSDVSPVSETFEDRGQAFASGQVPYNAQSAPLPEPSSPPAVTTIKRKPAPNRHSLSPENTPVQQSPPLRETEFGDESQIAKPVEGSHFSWTTGAPSIAPTRTSMETNSPPSRHINQFASDVLPMRFPSPPPSPPPAVPSKFKTPPVQSILSRQRPIQRVERDQWTTPARKTTPPESEPASATTAATAAMARSKLSISPQSFSKHGSEKKLPLPPELLTPVSPMSHLEALLTEEQDRIHQRKNVERAIAELTRVEKASPLEVSYAEVKDADKKLKELRSTLAEVRLEEREIGIAISRARRKEGEDEGLWVRRVTG